MLDSLEVKRQLLHAGGVVTPVFVYYLGRDFTLLLLFLLLLMTSLASFAYRRQVRLPVLYSLVEELERSDVKRSFPAKGAVYYVFGMILSLLVFATPVALACIVVTSVGDAASTIVGKRFGVHRLPYHSHKSFEGSAACFVFASVVAVTQIGFVAGVVAGFVGAVTESLPLPLNDNLSIPLAVGVVLTVMSPLF
jgi:dolichol kinase